MSPPTVPGPVTAEGSRDSGCWLGREDFTTRFVAVSTDEDGPIASIGWEAAITALDAGELPCSGGKHRILRLAASLAGFLTTDELLRSPHMSARLTAFLSSAGHQHPGHDACLLIDDVSFTAARLRPLAGP
jgi:hypothetical protein